MTHEKQNFWQHVLMILNAPITIWLLSVVFISIGGAYYSTFQQCHRDFDQYKEKYDRIANEYYTRRQLISSRLAAAKTINDVKAAINSNEGMYSEFRGKSLNEIADLFVRLSAQIEFDTFVSVNAEKRMSAFRAGLDEQEGLFLLAYGVLPDLKEKDLPAIRNFGADFSGYVEDWSDIYVKPLINAKCRLDDIFKIAIGEPTLRGKALSIGGFMDFASEYANDRARLNNIDAHPDTK